MNTLTTGSRPTLRATMKDDAGSVIDLRGATVRVRYSIAGAAVVVGTATLTDATAGIAEYVMPELTVAGPFVREWEISSGVVNRSGDKFRSKIRDALV